MKKAVFLLIILAIIGGWWYANRQNTTTIVVNPADTAGRPDPSNATFRINEESIELKNGRAERKLADTGLIEETTLTNIIAYGDLNADGQEDAAFIIVSTSAVSGALNSYLAAYVSGTVRYKPTTAVPIGTQVSPKSVSIDGNTITVTYLDRRYDEPLAADPSVTITKTFRFNENLHTLEER